jgi:serine/threonine protein kinase/predicted TPR repeat methyltransferase
MDNSYSADQNRLSPGSNAQASAPESANQPVQPSTDGEVIGSRRRLAPGTELSDHRYRIERLVASGGMGAVYRAIDTRFNRPCAVKEMLDEFSDEKDRAQAVEWFSREATLLLDLNHPCIPRVRDFFIERGRHYLVMDFIDGSTLAEVLEKEGNVLGIQGVRGVTEVRARTWARQLCDVLNYLHRQTPPIIFRDLKPSNIMVTGRDEIRLIDFGIARSFQSQGKATIIMTLGYAPPEQLHGQPEPRSDIYSLGATLYRLLTAHDAANNKPSIFAFPPLRSLRPDISPGFEQVIMKALAYAPDQRWQSGMEMGNATAVLPPVTGVPPMRSEPVSGGPVTGGNRSSGPQGNSMPGPVAGSSAFPPQQSAPNAGMTGPAGTYIADALRHLAAGRTEDAYGAVQFAYGREPNNALVHKLFGQVFARRRPAQIDQAIQAYRRSLELNPADTETHKLLGDVWLYLRPMPTQAIPEYVESLRLNAQDPETHFRLGQCYEKTRQLDQAMSAYHEAFKLAKGLPNQSQMLVVFAQTLGNLAFYLRRYNLAEEAFVQLLFLNPSDYATRFQLSQVYENENRLDDALRECEHVLRSPGVTPAVQQMRQRLRMRMGR